MSTTTTTCHLNVSLREYLRKDQDPESSPDYHRTI
jgi:hypothetical protein